MTKTKLIAKLNPCGDARVWLKGKTPKEAWETCERPDWMYWAIENLGYRDDVVYRKLACAHALSVAHLWEMPDVVRRYLETRDETIRDAAWAAARAAADAAGTAAGAAWSAAWAAAAGTAAGAAWAALAAARGPARAARYATRYEQCDIIREHIPWEAVAKLIKEAQP